MRHFSSKFTVKHTNATHIAKHCICSTHILFPLNAPKFGTTENWKNNAFFGTSRRFSIFLCRSGLQSVPSNAKAHYNFANLQKDAGNVQLAARHYREALRYGAKLCRYHRFLRERVSLSARFSFYSIDGQLLLRSFHVLFAARMSA